MSKYLSETDKGVKCLCPTFATERKISRLAQIATK